MPSKLWERDADGTSSVLLEPFEYTDIDHRAGQVRFLILHPYAGDKTDEEGHVECTFEVVTLDEDFTIPFTAVEHARGYRKYLQPIELDGKSKFIPATLELFFRHFRQTDTPIRLWDRQLCINIDNSDEKSWCYNIPYVESLQSRATALVDMADFMCRLHEQGIIPTIFSHDDVKPKTWENQLDKPDEYVWPSVFPNKLGKQSRIEAAFDTYEYVPLDVVADEIRVLILEVAEDPTAPLITHMAHCPIGCNVNWLALSYKWGHDEEKESITVNGLLFTVSKSLADILRAIRRADTAMPLWIDAICIDQQNIPERNRQLVRMSDIYYAADAVVSYLGTAGKSNDMVLDFVRTPQAPVMEFDRDKNCWILKSKDGKLVEPSDVPVVCGALYLLLTRSYFRRVWILQEVAVGSVVWTWCGKTYHASFEELDSSAYYLLDMLRHDRELAGQMVEAMPEIETVSLEALGYIRTLSFFRHLYKDRYLDGYRFATIRPDSPGYLETAILARKFEATVPSDKIYALWNLAQDKEGFDFKMDYSIHYTQAFKAFAAEWSNHSGSLDIIGAAEPNPESEGFYVRTPSWVPDWSIASQISCLVRREQLTHFLMRYQDDMDGPLYCADGHVIQARDSTNYFHFEKDMLHCCGILIDHLAYGCAVGSEDSETKQPTSRLDALAERIFSQLGAAQSFFEIVEDGPKSRYEDVERAAWATICGDSIDAWPRKEDTTEEHFGVTIDESFVCLREKSRHLKTPVWSEIDMLEQMAVVMRGRHMFITGTGYFALAPEALLKTDNVAIAILATCSVPVLLTEVSEGVYKFLGTCFVQGCMDGEMVASRRFKSAEEFWAGEEQVQRLKII